jgi:molybdenum cofactor cytidylyltransferase
MDEPLSNSPSRSTRPTPIRSGARQKGFIGLVEAFGVKSPELIALVGAGGKTTLAFRLVDELRTAHQKVVLTTTTKMGADQTGGLPVTAPDPVRVRALLDTDGACLVVASTDGHKAMGPPSEWVDHLYDQRMADVIVVEADGARQRRVKAPAPHEPLIPSRTTLVVAVMAADAINRVIEDVAHRPLRVAAAAGCSPYDHLTPARAARLLANPIGGRKGVPESARFIVAITKVTDFERVGAGEVAALLAPVECHLLEAHN